MGACYCSLAGTTACKNCPNNYSNSIDDIHPKWWSNYIYDNMLSLYRSTKEQLDSITIKEDEWEIPSFMLKGDEYDRKS